MTCPIVPMARDFATLNLIPHRFLKQQKQFTVVTGEDSNLFKLTVEPDLNKEIAMNKHHKLIKNGLILTVSTLIMLTSIGFAAETSQKLAFPLDRSMGVLHIRNGVSTNWQVLGEARGNVVVPAKKALKLKVSVQASKDLSPLVSLKDANLQELDLSKTKVNDAGLVHLAGLASLKTLNLSQTSVGDKGLVHLKQLKSLEELNLSKMTINGTGFVHLAGLRSLKRVNLGNTEVQSHELVHLTKSTTLQFLSLNDTRIDDTGLEHLTQLVALRELNLKNTKMSDAGVTYLSQRLLPSCNIIR